MINSISFSGYLAQDPVVRSPQDSNDTFITFSVCVHFANGEEFINCCSNGDDAKYLAQNAKKGDRVSVSGRLKLNKWTNRSGEAIQKLGVQTYGVEWAPKGAVANMQQSQPQQEYPQRPQTQQAAPRPQQSYNGPQAAPRRHSATPHPYIRRLAEAGSSRDQMLTMRTVVLFQHILTIDKQEV